MGIVGSMVGVEPTNNSISFFYYKVTISAYMLLRYLYSCVYYVGHWLISSFALMRYLPQSLTAGGQLCIFNEFLKIPATYNTQPFPLSEKNKS